MKTIYIVLTDTGTLFTRMIKRVTNAPYNHASIALDPQLQHLYSFGRKSLRLFWNAGFVREGRDEGIFRVLRRTTCVVLALRVDADRYDRIVREIARFELEAERYKYNFLGLFNFALGRPLHRSNAYFCSEFVATVLLRSGIDLVKKPPGLTAPHDFMACPALIRVYEGPLSGYPSGAPAYAGVSGGGELTA